MIEWIAEPLTHASEQGAAGKEESKKHCQDKSCLINQRCMCVGTGACNGHTDPEGRPSGQKQAGCV
ncbi:MAG: hypothetical protein HYX75_02630 [Acidobacteria bacterium]|nr:hypothetical protein [Acidobacteriota bacterium]